MDKFEVKETAEKYIYSDYAKFDDEIRRELIDGVIYMMAPAPSQKHQEISAELTRQLKNFLLGKPCKVFHAPFDVCLNAAGDSDNTVVQPDVLVVCDKSKLDGKRCDGAPDFIIEILSPSNTKHDTLRKFDKYLQTGVREYWIIDPEREIVHTHVLKNVEYVTKLYSSTDVAAVSVLEGCMIDFNGVFAE